MNQADETMEVQMRIAIVTLSRITGNKSSFYNAQDMGLARALVELGYEVVVYRLTSDVEHTYDEGAVKVIQKRVKGLGKQSLTDFSFMVSEVSRVICFSDNQVSFSKLVRWCQEREIILLPYVGVVQSNSPHKVIRMVMNLLVRRNIKAYQHLTVYAKTPGLMEELHKVNVVDTVLAPVGLNIELLKEDSFQYDRKDLKEEYGYNESDQVILFVGRMEPEKEPFMMIELFEILYQENASYKLLMVGQGKLSAEVEEKVKKSGLEHSVRILPQVPYQEMWKLYCIADCFVNLNKQEIYGMSILEALYYNCPVVAWHAPGPTYIMETQEQEYKMRVKESLNCIQEMKRGQDLAEGNCDIECGEEIEKIGYLCETEEEVLRGIRAISKKTHSLPYGGCNYRRQFIVESFLWEDTARQFLE